jgi:hypothetical protein
MLHRIVVVPVLLEVVDVATTKALVVLVLDIDDAVLSDKIGTQPWPWKRCMWAARAARFLEGKKTILISFTVMIES